MPSLKDKHMAMAVELEEEASEIESGASEEEDEVEETDAEETKGVSGETASSDRAMIKRKRGRPTRK